jgi:Transposase IS66 family
MLTSLLQFIHDGCLEIDNNAAERAPRAVAIGRKNYLFQGSDVGGESAAAMYRLIGTAKRNDLDPEAYLSYPPCSTVLQDRCCPDLQHPVLPFALAAIDRQSQALLLISFRTQTKSPALVPG